MITSKKIFLAALIAGAVCVGISVYAADKPVDKPTAQGGPASAPPAVPVVAVPVIKKDIARTITTVGSLLASESADINSEIAGKIEKINFEEGMPVKKGDILLEIDSGLLKADFSKADAAYRVATASLERDRKLYGSKYISTQELDESKSTLQQRQAERDSARIILDRAMVKAPFDGLMGLRNFSVGDYVDIGKVLTTIDAYDPINIEFSVPERNFSDIRKDQTISFETDAWPSDVFNGKIYAVDSRINPATRSVQVKAMADNADGKLRSGMYARITIETSVSQGSLVIPEEAVSSKGDKDFVFIIQDGKANTRFITIDTRQNGEVSVREGLEEGDMIVAAGIQRVREGMNVSIEKAPEQPVQK